jgi:hypothetical protein
MLVFLSGLKFLGCLVDNKTMAKTASKKIKVKKPSSAQLHDLALGIALQAIDKPMVSNSTAWDKKSLEQVLWDYLCAKSIFEQGIESVSHRVQTWLDGV